MHDVSHIPVPNRRLGQLFILSAPSGAGKSSLVAAVIDHLKDRYPIERFVTYTSREPRVGEEQGKDFHFISTEAFEAKIAAGEFLEWSDALGTYYGTHNDVLDQLALGKSGFLVIDRPGAARLSQLIPHVLLIWVKVPSLAVLEERLCRRGTETPDQIAKRLRRATQEMAAEAAFPQYNVCVENDDFGSAVSHLEQIVEAKLKTVKTF